MLFTELQHVGVTAGPVDWRSELKPVISSQGARRRGHLTGAEKGLIIEPSTVPIEYRLHLLPAPT